MIDLDKIESAARKPWYCRSKQEDNLLSPEVLVDLITRLRQAEKDAARYRWLRESASTEDHGGFAYNFRLVDAIRYMPGSAPNETMGIDEAIDEAMQCSK